MTDMPWDPPWAGSETEHLVGALERLRATFRWKADDLDRDGLQTRIGPSALTLGGLLKHLALMEDHQFGVKLTGEPLGEPWRTGLASNDNWDYESADQDSPADLYALYDDAVVRARVRLEAALANGGLDQLVHMTDPAGRPASLRRLVCDMVEEYGRHTGHADLLRETVDGRVGEDPPADWRPRSGGHAHRSGHGSLGAAGRP